MKTRSLSAAQLRQKGLEDRLQHEIEHAIFPQLVGEKNCGYPFGRSQAELEKLAAFGSFDARLNIEMLEARLSQLPETYRNALRYLVYRDVNGKLSMYLAFARRFRQARAQSLVSSPQPVM